MTADLAASLEAACRRWAARPATTHRGRTLSYGQVWDRITALAHSYRTLGIGAGARVVCQLPVCPEHLISAAAAWAVGAVHVGAHKDLTGAELAALVQRTQAGALVYQPAAGAPDPLALLEEVRAVCPGIATIVHGHRGAAGQHSLSELLAEPGTSAGTPAPAPGDDPAVLLSTSGTTGAAKLVVETLPALWAKVQFFADTLEPSPDDVHLLYLPVCHAFGLKLALMALASGGRLVLLERFTPAEALRLVGDEQVTVLPATPTHLTLLLRALEPGHRVDSLRWVATAAAPLPPDLAEQLHERLGVDVYSVYGCSEGFLTATAERDHLRRGSVGKTVFRGPPGSAPDGTLAVLHPERDERLAARVVGEVAYGAARPVAYWDQPPVATDGWYRTGDLGWLDDDGCLSVTGRLKEMVNRGGLKVSPVEVETRLAAHPAVRDCAVIPVPDPVLGEAICACVVPAGATVPSLLELRRALAASLSRHKLPDELCVLEAIPRSSVGKIDRRALADRVVDGSLPRERVERAETSAVTPAAPAPGGRPLR